MITLQYNYSMNNSDKIGQSTMKVMLRLLDDAIGQYGLYKATLFSGLGNMLCSQGYSINSFTDYKCFSKVGVTEDDKPIAIHLAVSDPIFSRLRLARDLNFRASGRVSIEEFIDIEKLKRNLAGLK